MNALRIGLIGIGHITLRAHLPPILEKVEAGEVELAAFCDVNEDSAREHAEAHAVPAVYTDHHAMFDNEQLDAVYLCIPPTLHDDVELICAEKGIALFIEKPQTLDVAQALKFEAAITKSGIVSQVGFMSRYYDASDTVKARVAELTPRHASIDLWYSGTPARFWTSRMDLCGGTFVENTIHYVDLLRYFLGDIESVQAFYVERKAGEGPAPMDLPHVYNVSYRFASGVTASAVTSRVLTNVKASRREVAVISDDSLIVWDRNQATENGEPTGAEEKGETAFAKQADAFLDAVRKGDPGLPRSPYTDALNSLAAVLGANESASRGGELVHLKELME